MKKILNYLLSTLLLLNLVGCNESTKNETKKEGGINVSVTVPSIHASGNKEKKQFKSFRTDVQSVLLEVIKSARTASDGSVITSEVLSIEEMTKDVATGIWSVNLVLNPNDAPFNFNAMAYEGAVTVATVTSNTPIFTGEVLNTTNDTVIVLEETEESINDSVKKLPLLKSVDTLINNNSSFALTFNLGYPNGGIIGYELSSVAYDGAGAECTTSLFTSSSGTVNFTSVVEATFNATLVENPATCSNPKHFLKMTTTDNDTMKVAFTLDVDNLTVSIALPPVIENINVLDTDTNFALDVVVTDSNNLSLSYEWSVVKGTGTLDTPTAQTTNLSGFDRNDGLEILIAVTNITTGAVSSIRYTLIDSPSSSGNPPITIEALRVMVANGDDITQVNTSEITDLSSLFFNLTSFNQDISAWDTSAVTNMESLFDAATSFNQDISAWDTSAVTNMTYMFYQASAFNQNIRDWNTSAVTSMGYMFHEATSFNQSIGVWNTSAVTDMSGLFYGASAFNQNIGDWNTSAVTNMEDMFMNTLVFNQNIASWDTSLVTTMHSMFKQASVFNQNISSWNVNNVIYSDMFNDNSALIQNNMPNFITN